MGEIQKIFQTVSHKIYKEFFIVKTNKFDKLEETLQTLGDKSNLSFSKKQAIRDKVFQSIGQVELAEAIVKGEQKATIAVSLQYLKKALIPQKLNFSIPTTIAVMIFIFASSIMTGALAQNANPTQLLFPVKRVLEKIELAFISNPVNKAEFRLNIADERLKYLEISINQEDSLSKVLTESQIALVDARTALAVIKDNENEEDAENITELIERFSLLLGDQRTILNNIEQNIDNTDEDVKNVMLAIRETIAEDAISDINPDNVIESTNNLVAIVVDNKLPTAGFVNLSGTMGSYSAKPVIIVDNIRYFLVGSAVDLIPYMGVENATVFGNLDGNTITLTKILINSKIIWEARINTSYSVPVVNASPDFADK